MGNSGSQSGQITQHRPLADDQQWAHSFPRTQPRLHHHHQHKVLPERDARQKLRHTNNGEILQSGGTLSGRHHQSRLSLREENHHHTNDNRHAKPTRSYLPNQRDPLHKSGSRYQQQQNADYKNYQNGYNNHQSYRENMKKFGSEPDLRQSKIITESSSSSNNKEFREKSSNKAKKKYKAPPPPKLSTEKQQSSLEWDENSSGDNGPTRRARLFKTRAETKKNYSSPVNKHKSLEQQQQNEDVQMRDQPAEMTRSNRLSLPDLAPNFHQELKEVTTRLRHTRVSTDNALNNELNANSNNNVSSKEKLKTLDHNIHKRENIRQRLKQMSVEVDDSPIIADCVRGDGSGKESSSPDQSSPRVIRTTGGGNKDPHLPKTFYFGMDEETMQNDDYHNDIVEHFASNLHSMTHIQKIANSSESDLSSEIEVDENQSRHGIDLQLRPILPKKQLEIPRFSPAAAWKLLSAIDSNPTASTIASDDVPIFIEDRIEKYARPPPPSMQIGQRSNNDKSGDSGISGDAGPVGYDDSPDVLVNSRNSLVMPATGSRNQGISWTPQQDLGDDSSMEEGLNNNESSYKSRQSKYTNKPHVFSLSLPRDNQLSSYMADKATYPTSLQKIKRSVSGVLGNLATNNKSKDFMQPNLSQDQSDNWFLSKSAPNSLNNGFNSLEMKHSNKSDDKEQMIGPKSSGRLMYLPEFDVEQDHRQARPKTKDDLRERSKSADRLKNSYRMAMLSKSCENISNSNVKSDDDCQPEDLQDPPKMFEDAGRNWNRKPKRFTFQSTVRQIERRRLAEKLSREAEKKEKQRLRELEAMQKVEEEFQKKRAGEKATIRQQLRLFSMDDVAWSSLPPNLEGKDDIRQEPDGAVSSSTTSSPSLPPHKTEQSKKVYQKNKQKVISSNNKRRPSSESSEDTRIKAHVTQVLSEYRHPQREYKDYTGTRYLNDLNDANHATKTTIHPQVTYNMPKAKQSSTNKTSGTNYRKDFAHGVRSTRSAGSSYSEDSQSRNNSPRMYHNKYAPMTRF